MKVLIVRAIAVVAVILATLAPVRAADGITGVFAAADCREPDEVLVKSDVAGLWIYEDYVHLFKIDKEVGHAGWQQIDSDTYRFFARMQKDGRLEVASPPNVPRSGSGDVGRPAARSLPGIDWEREVYERCRALPLKLAAIHGEAVQVVLGAGDSYRACRNSGAAECTAAIFRLADVTGDKVLTTAEITRAVRVAAYFGISMDTSAAMEDYVNANLVTHAFGPILAKTLIANYDYDDDGGLSLVEILQDRENILGEAWTETVKTPDHKAVKDILDQLKRLPGLLSGFGK